MTFEEIFKVQTHDRKKSGQYAIRCNVKIAIDRAQNSAYCDSEEEAQELVKDECWVPMDKGWICVNCNVHYLKD